MKAVQRSETRYLVYKGTAVAWQIIRHIGDRRWYVHSYNGEYLPQRGQQSPLEAVQAYGLDVSEWADHEEKQAPAGALARARTIIGSVLSRTREQSKT